MFLAAYFCFLSRLRIFGNPLTGMANGAPIAHFVLAAGMLGISALWRQFSVLLFLFSDTEAFISVVV